MSAWALGDYIFSDGKGAWADMNRIQWNPFNTNEEAALASKYFSFYKGATVFRTGNAGGSYSIAGMIFLAGSETVADTEWKNHINHEYGHIRQGRLLGFGAYATLVAIPSAISFRFWLESHEDRWFERWANELGGVGR
jgi:hypothetical protein